MFRPGDLHLARRSKTSCAACICRSGRFRCSRKAIGRRRSASIGIAPKLTPPWEDGKPVTHTRTVTETEWWPLSGQHHNYYSGYLVSGSRGLPQGYAERIKPFRLEALKRYQPYFLAGWLSEEYSVERDAALALCQQEFLTLGTEKRREFPARRYAVVGRGRMPSSATSIPI